MDDYVIGPVKARKRPVVIDAIQIISDNFDAIVEFINKHQIDAHVNHRFPRTWVEVDTLEGPQIGEAGWWLLVGVEGEGYICKDSIFRSTYDFEQEGMEQ